ncbi:MAG: twin-arginine translocase subunit TatC [Thermoplasmataceae archaeon]
MDEGPIRLIINNLEELRIVAIRILKVFFLFFLFFFFFKEDTINFGGYNIPFVYPSPYYNMGDQLFGAIKYHLINKKFTLILINSTDGVVADLYSCLFLTLIFSSPWITYYLSSFISPALKPKEKEVLRQIIIPATLLFLFGSFIGLYYVAPDVFTILYYYDSGLGALPTMSVTSFISFFLVYVLTFGLAFETPIIMIGITRSGLVGSDYWFKNWRYAVVGALIFGVIFSPGMIGFTMMLLAIPIIVLYFLGAYISRRFEKKNDDNIIDISNN